MTTVKHVRCRRIYRWAQRVSTVTTAAMVLLVVASTAVWADDDRHTDQLKSVLENVRLWIVGIAGVVVAVMLTVAGLRYLMAGGDPGETEKAKTAVRAAAIGFAIVVLAPVIVAILQGILKV